LSRKISTTQDFFGNNNIIIYAITHKPLFIILHRYVELLRYFAPLYSLSGARSSALDTTTALWLNTARRRALSMMT